MKALSGYGEWFWTMCLNIKDVENRNWSLFRYFKPTDLPVRVYLHSSRTPASLEEITFIKSNLSPEQLRAFNAVNWKAYRGVIIGEITIIGQCQKDEFKPGDPVSPWFFGDYGFWVKSGVLYDKPIAYKGQLGFFNVNLGNLIQ